MRSSIDRAEWYQKLSDIDRIHDSKIYKIDPNSTSRIEVNTFWPDFSVKEKLKIVIEEKQPDAWQPPMIRNQNRIKLKTTIRENHKEIHQRVVDLNATINPRTQAHNRKSAYTSIEEEHDFRSDIVAEQIRAWRCLLPTLIKKLSRIPDPRRTKSVKHKLTVLMIFGLFAFIFRLQSRREMNRELTGPLIQEHLKKIFPEIDTIPHSCTLARLLETINPNKIEAVHIELVKELIKKKKFKPLLINGCLPITIDGTQKLYRNGLLEDARWCERKVGNSEDDNMQQYIYVVEANITLSNGLNIPLITEYLYRENNKSEQTKGKQDSGTPRGVYISEVKVLTRKRYLPHLGSSFELMAVTT